MNKLFFFYCCLYKWSEKVNGKRYNNLYSASLMMTFILMVLFGALVSFVSYKHNLDILSIEKGGLVAACFPVLIFIAVHSCFSKKGKMEAAMRNFYNSSSVFRDRPGLLVGVVLGGAFSILIAVWVLLW